MTACDTAHVFTICFYDYDILSLIEMFRGAVFQKTDHLIDTRQRSMEVGSWLLSVTCRCTNAKDEIVRLPRRHCTLVDSFVLV